MNELKKILGNNGAVYGVLLLIIIILGGFLFSEVVSYVVIDKLKKEYTPGPYAPGFDPDKVNPNLWQQQQQQQPQFNGQ